MTCKLSFNSLKKRSIFKCFVVVVIVLFLFWVVALRPSQHCFQSCREVYLGRISTLIAMKRKCLIQEHNTEPLVRFKPETLRSRVDTLQTEIRVLPY